MLGPVLPVATSGPTTVEWIASLVAAGGFPLLSTYLSDKRKIRHERGLRKAESLSDHLEKVQVALEALADRAATLRGHYLSVAATRPEEMWPLIHNAEDAFQTARAAIARLGMQPSADEALVTRAQEAAKAHHEAAKTVRVHQLKADMARASGQQEPIEANAAGTVIESIEKGYKGTREYEEQAKAAIRKLLS